MFLSAAGGRAIVVGEAATSPAHPAHTKSTQKHAANGGQRQKGSAAVALPTDLPFTCALPLRASRVNCAGNACNAAAAPTNGGAGTCDSSLDSGSSCTPTCNSGYTASGSRSCSYGSYTNTFECKPDPCKLTAPTNGALGTCASSLTSGSSCTPSCNSGYTVYGSYSCLATALSGVSRSLPIMLIRRDLPCPASPVLAQ